MTPYVRKQLDRLYEFQHGEDIPKRDRGWFWKTFKELKGTGLTYGKAWHYTVLVLENYYERRS